MPVHSDPGKSSDIFISYAHVDDKDGWVSGFVESLEAEHARFTPQPLQIFLDRESIQPGDDWEHRIRHALKSSKVMIAILSPAYFQSVYCHKEWEWYCELELELAIPGEGITPIYTVTVPHLEQDSIDANLEMWISDLKRRQFFDVRPWRPDGVKALQATDVQKRVELLDQQISARLTRVQASRDSISTIPEHNHRFVGRREELRKLRESLQYSRLGAITTIHGLGGIGKSALAFEYAHAFAAEYLGGRFLVNAAGATDLRPLIVQLAPYLEIELTAEERDNLDLAYERVSRSFKAGPMRLLLLDNLDDPVLVSPQNRSEMLPGGDFVHILITTRVDADQFHDIQTIPLDSLPEEDGLKLLERHRQFVGEEEWKAAIQIVHVLGGYPLALEVVAVYLWKNPEISYCQYLQRLRKEKLVSIDAAASDNRVHLSRHRQKFLTPLLQPTLDQLTSPQLLAIEFAALLPPDRIPWPWLASLVRNEYPDDFKPPEPGYPDEWQRLRRHLAALRLIIDGDDSHSGRMHRLVQDVVVARIGNEPHCPLPTTILKRMLRSLFSRSERFRKAREQLMNMLVSHCFNRVEELSRNTVHLQATWELAALRDFAWTLFDIDDQDAVHFGHQVGGLLSRASMYEDDRRLLRRVLSALNSRIPLDLLSAATVGGTLGTIEAKMGNLKVAKELYLQAAQEFESLRAAGEADQKQAAARGLRGTYASLAVVEGYLEDSDAAMEMRRRAIAVPLQSLGGDAGQSDDSIDRAMLIRDEGDRESAYRKLRELLNRADADDSANPSQIALICHNLGNIASELGKHPEALEFLERALQIDRERFPEDHPTLVTDYCSLGLVEYAMKRLDAARGHLREALRILDRHFPDGHYQHGICLLNLAHVEYVDGHPELARDLYRRALERLESDLPAAHSTVTAAWVSLASLERSRGDRMAATEAVEKGVQGMRNAKPVRLANLIDGLRLLGYIQLELQNWSDASKTFTELITFQRQSLSTDDSMLADSYFHYSLAAQNLGQMPLATQAMYAAYRLRHAKLGADNDLTQKCLNWLKQNAPSQLTATAPQSPVTGPVNPAQIEEARREVSALITQVRNLTSSDLSPKEFCKILVSNCVKALSALNGRMWLRDTHNEWTCLAAAHGNLPSSAEPYRDATWIRVEAETSAQTIAEFGIGLRRLVDLNSVNRPTIPTNSNSEKVEVLRIVARFPIHEGVGILEIDQRKQTTEATVQGYTRFVWTMAGLGQAYFSSHNQFGLMEA